MRITGMIMVIWLAMVVQLEAKNVDLVTVPPRDKVQLTIYNSEDITLVRETRFITFKKGSNLIQFSWANTLIDPTSVELIPKQQQDKIEILDTTFPADRPQVLIWNISSEVEGQVECELSYFTSGLSWAADYVGISDPAEKSLQLDGYVQIFNQSGEDYENAQVRLVVGVINLVEKIRDLAQRQGIQPPKPGDAEWREIRNRAAAEALSKADVAAKSPSGAPNEKQIVKEGLSEYFIYTIEGTEDVANGWSKRMRSFKPRKVPFTILYRFREYQYGPEPVRFFIFKNDKAHELGESPMPDGIVRMFRDNGRDGLSFLVQQNVRYIPLDEDIEINLGRDEEIVYEMKKLEVSRDNFTFDHDTVNGWDETEKWNERIRNYKDKPIKMEIRRQWQGDMELSSEYKPRSHDFKTVEFTFEVEAHKTLEYGYTTVRHMGKNTKQQRLLVK